MNYKDRMVSKAIDRLERGSVVPLDEIFGLVEQGVNFRDLDNKHNRNNRTYPDGQRPNRPQLQC